MERKHHGTASTVAMFLVFSVSQVYVHAIYAVPNATPNLIGEALMNGAGMNGAKMNWAPQGAGQLSGRLMTRNNQPIMVDGTSTNAGATVFSGAHFQTPDGVSATVDLGPLGVVDFEPNTDAVLTFTETGINVKVRRGCVKVTTKKDDVKGVITSEDGTATEETDAPKNKRRIRICFPILASAASTGGTSTAGIAAGIAAGIGTIIAVIVGTGDNDNNPPIAQPTPTPPVSPST
jgi:hypothetical protein